MCKLKIMSCLLIIIITICAVSAQSAINYHDGDDVMGRRDKEKMILLSEDLLKEALLRMRQLYEIKIEHKGYTPFHIGLIIGKVREKFLYMLDLYEELLTKRHKRSELYPPADKELKPIHYIITLELVHYLELEIENLLHVLEEQALPGLATANLQIGGPPDMRQKAAEEAAKQKKDLKKRKQAQKNSLRRSVKEEKAKSILRQKYLMVKLGMPSNMTTTRKRFLHQWPVEATWNLEKYNYY
ncbi:unnamed protein product [Spodoptera littoralis]|uniref:Uncharacterized protein n=1 Tax=Spodoptera littoralis TaxID=7109 RepID=A0A9P0N7P6_SPOLI|nr:unnamed protein product [Spodoptera littoralis]CAH1642801.1 unnamed protein product [Spodoptera littoralis]